MSFHQLQIKLVSPLAAKQGTNFLGKLVIINFRNEPFNDYITEEIQWEDKDLHKRRLEPTNS